MQQSQLRNYVLFFVLSMVFAFGYGWVKLKLNPPPPPAQPDVAWTLEQRREAELAARLAAAATTGTPADLAALATEPALTRDALLQYAVAAKSTPAPAPAPEPAPAVDVAKITPITLGGDGFQMRVKLTPLGAGVRQLVLNHFHQADRYGLPDKTHPEGLELIPEESPPSFLLLHYAKEDDARPLDTLGHKVWDVTSQQLQGDRQEVAFTTDLPDQGLRIT